MSIEAIKLSYFFKQIKKPRYILGTTYTLSLAFFESSIFPLLDRSNLKACLIVSDSIGYQHALIEGPALQNAAQNYLVMPATISGCFHPKVWIVVGEKEAAILVGSGNLTQSGFMSNAELFDSAFFSQNMPAPPEFLASMKSFVTGLILMWREEDREKLLCTEVLTEIKHSLGTIPTNQNADGLNCRFIHSYDGAMLDKLPSENSINELFVATPYFGGDTSGLQMLVKHLGSSTLHIFPGIHAGRQIDLPIDRVNTELAPATLAALEVPGKSKALAHLKLYGMTSGSDGWILCTSANCTVAAWEGKNVEAGLLRRGSADFVRGYFAKKKDALPNDLLSYSATDFEGVSISVWAADTGLRLEVNVGADSAKYLPMKEVEFVIRMGSKVAKHTTDLAFEEHRTEKLAWVNFNGIGNRRGITICLDIKGRAKNGSPIRGACFVENRHLLTADPMYRSAWRGALALLDADAVPELGDIAAIFGMVDNIFAGRLISRSHVKVDLADDADDGKIDDEQIHIAIWPPQPDTQELQRKIGSTGMGQLRWCQNILEMFLKPMPSSEPTDGYAEAIVAAVLDDDKLTDEEQQQKLQETEKQQMRLSSKIWNYAARDFQRLINKLQSLVPDAHIAPNVWPAAIFVFLATTAMHRAARRAFKDSLDMPQLADLCDGFLLLMLNQRRQHHDFCCPYDLRYQHLPFPPLADDLRRTFKIEPHPDISVVMIALLVDQKMRKDAGHHYPPTIWTRSLRLATSREFNPDAEFQNSCLQIWKQFIRDIESEHTEDDFVVNYRWLIDRMELQQE